MVHFYKEPTACQWMIVQVFFMLTKQKRSRKCKMYMLIFVYFFTCSKHLVPFIANVNVTMPPANTTSIKRMFTKC